MMVSRFKKHSTHGGFSLLELSIVIAIVSVVAIMGLEASAVYISSTAYQSTATRMATIDAALAKYRYVHGRLPCPSPLPLAITDGGGVPPGNQGYGKQDCTATTVAGGGISGAAVTAKGSGYIGYYTDVALTIEATNGLGSGATGKGIVDPATGRITSISITNAGGGYTPPGGSVTVTPQPMGSAAAGANLSAYLTISGAGGIECSDGTPSPCAISTPADGGSGYSESYTNFAVTFSAGSLAVNGAASGIANVNPSTGEIESITITNPGYGYQVGDSVSVIFSGAKEGIDGLATSTISPITVGGLPVRDLNLPLAYALDAYGSKFVYYVTQSLTDTTIGATNTFAAATGVIQMRNGQLQEPCAGNCSVTSGGAAYTLISVGKDQRGGYNQRGILISNCIPQASFSSAIDAQNCIFQGSPTTPIGVAIPLGVLYTSRFNNGTQNSGYFDDLIITRAKQDL